EDVAAHVADADDGDVLGLGVAAHLAEVATHRLPRTAGGDAHRLVVVPRRPAGGEGVVEPELPLPGHRVGDVGEGGRALVGGDDEVGVVAVVAHRLRRRLDPPGDAVVGDVEQRADELAVGVLPGGEPRGAIHGGVG